MRPSPIEIAAPFNPARSVAALTRKNSKVRHYRLRTDGSVDTRPPSKVYDDRHRVKLRRTLYVPGSDPGISLLSRPTKMPGPSWSLPAGRPGACPFMVVGANTICGVCYAKGEHAGRYASASVQRAQWARFDWTRACMRSSPIEFVETLIEAIEVAGDHPYMRVHDSGDLFSERYTRCWIEICAAIPKTRFWFPTRSWRAPWVQAIVELNALPNVTVRPSSIHFDEAPPEIAGLAAGTTASAVLVTCPAPKQHNACGACRTCWDRPELPVSYHAH